MPKMVRITVDALPGPPESGANSVSLVWGLETG